MPSITLIGPGALGCCILAFLSETGRHTLSVVSRSPLPEVQVQTTKGLLPVSPRQQGIPDAAGPRPDWILVTTKTYDFESTLPWIERLAGPATRIAILQNGVEHLSRLPASFPRERIVPVIVDCPAERLGPGRVRHGNLALATAPDNEAGRDFAALFESSTLQVRLTDDWLTVAWRKLCLNAPGAASAVTQQPVGIVHFQPIEEVMRGVIREVVQVGRAEGARLDDSMVDAIIERERLAPRDAANSIYSDRMAGRQMEIEARNGVVVRLGLKHGIPTPYNHTLAAILQVAQAFPPRPAA